MKRIFIAAPYTNPDPQSNVMRALDVADELLRAGFAPYLPHLTCIWEMVYPHSYSEWCALHLSFVECCDALVRLPGESPGADKEVARAKELGIPVYEGVEALLNDNV